MPTLLKTDAVTLPAHDVFSPDKTFNCGQCFRFNENETSWQGVAGEYLITFPKNSSSVTVVSHGAPAPFLERFLDTSSSYTEINEDIFKITPPEHVNLLQKAAEVSRGMRILKQDFFEALISFIISQNNNIPRIKKNIASICENFGEKRISDGEVFYTFPSPEALLFAGERGLSECRLGFRTKYILDAALKIKNGDVSEEKLIALSNDKAKEELMRIHGVGPKVASCVLLYGLGRKSEVPVDVWMKKIFEKYFNSNFIDFGKNAGVVQQYLFFYERFIVEGKKI